MIFSHRSLLDKLYPLISSEKLGGERYFILTLKTSKNNQTQFKSTQAEIPNIFSVWDEFH